MSFNLIIGMGNTGSQIVRAAAESEILTDCKLYTIDSVTSNVDMKTVNSIESISLISDDKAGSGRSRERGAAMFEFHDNNGTFDELYAEAQKAKTPIIVITSSAGGTGSGTTPPLCRKLIAAGIQVIPIIVCPAMEDPVAFHMNTNDLLLELQKAEISTYCVFRNEYGKADYRNINKEVVSAIEIILGKRYDATDKDSIDDSDLDVILSTPGRFMAVEASAQTPSDLKRRITERVLNGHQPCWNMTDAESGTLMTAFALSSPFAAGDFEEVFSELNARIKNRFDEYRNICNKDGMCKASIIVAGLPPVELKQIDGDFQMAAGIADGVKSTAKRPAFMQKKGTLRSANFPKPFQPVNTVAPDEKKSGDVLDNFNMT